MLELVDSIPWHQLTHSQGEASDVPMHLRILASVRSEERRRAPSELYLTIVHQGTVYDSTAYAVPFLIEIASTRSLGMRADVLVLVGAIAESRHGSPAPRQALVARAESIVALLLDPEMLVRVAAAHVLGMLPELAPRAAPQLRRSIERESDDLARDGMMLSLGSIKDLEVENILWLEDRFRSSTDHRARFAVSVALAQAAGDGTCEAAVSFLAQVCADPSANSTLRWPPMGFGWRDAASTGARICRKGRRACIAHPVARSARRRGCRGLISCGGRTCGRVRTEPPRPTIG